ncbi:putative Ig domain-containing protein [Streptococcus criceti]|uniref:putative Ig domain-containing protein n=1 Tax=Streptococcus criceti TaxID=1333 RepID=UPI003B8481AA
MTAGDKTVNEKTPFEVPVTVTDNDDPAPSVEVTGLPDGVTYAPSTGKITGSAGQ